MCKVTVFIADGTEEVECLTIVDLLRRAGIEVRLVSIMDTEKIVSSRSRACMKVIQKTLNNAVNHSFISPFGIMPYGTAAVKFCLAGQSAKP